MVRTPRQPGPSQRTRRLVATGLLTVVLVGVLGAYLAGCTGDDDPSTGDTTASTATDTAPTPGPTSGGPPGDPTAPTVPGQTVPGPTGPDGLSAPLADPDATGRELAQRFLDILGNPTPAPLLEEFLSPAFQLQRSNGTFANKEEYVDQPASVSRFTILDEGFRAYQEGPTVTVRFRVTIEEEINGEQLRATEADRLGVFIRTSAGWQLLAWSNFNPVTPS